jgi:hypothetical protein
MEFERSLSSSLPLCCRSFACDPRGGLILARDAERGPPASLRVSPEAVIATLERAGLTTRVSSTVLPDQYIVEAVVAP